MSHWHPGDVLRITTPAGPRYVQITHLAAPYPPVLRGLVGGDAQGETQFIAMVDLPQGDPRIERMTPAAMPLDAQPFPTFRLAVRDRSGAPVYWWHWDGEGLRLAPEGANAPLPLREITPFECLIARLAAL